MSTSKIIQNQKDDDDDVPQQTKQETRLTYIQIPVELRKSIGQFLKKKFNGNEDAINHSELNETVNIIKKGLIKSEEELASSSSSFLYRGRTPRRDVLENFGKIAYLLIEDDTYPKISGLQLTKCINAILTNADNRTKNDYKQTIYRYCNRDYSFGSLDVSFFVQQIPKQYILAPIEDEEALVN